MTSIVMKTRLRVLVPVALGLVLVPALPILVVAILVPAALIVVAPILVAAIRAVARVAISVVVILVEAAQARIGNGVHLRNSAHRNFYRSLQYHRAGSQAS